MKRHVFRWVFAFFACATQLGSVGAQDDVRQFDPLVVPIYFHLVENLQMRKAGVSMETWVSDRDIENVIVPEINRIWRPAKISFVISKTIRSKALSPSNKQEYIDYVVNSHRDEEGQSDPKRLQMLDKLIDWRYHDERAINIYFVPYLGSTSQGNASRKRMRIFIGQYTDKPSGGKRPPQRGKLIEPEPFKDGSLARTAAHEIGHILGLSHPDPQTQVVFERLMGGKKDGYGLTPEEIRVARSKAALWKTGLSP